MIGFICAHCGGKFQVKPEFGGRSTRCPTCKQTLVVPDITAVTAGAINEILDGTATGSIQGCIHEGITLEADTRLHTGHESVPQLLSRRSKKGERYIVGGEIARGGMGTIARAVDCDIRREIAVKSLLDQTDASKKLRFVEEAQITGQLEHPNIVPIHELGADAEGRLFFTMKMVKGRSLAQVLSEQQEARSERREDTAFTLSRLLTILVNVCHALAYAHARGVIHRDLKPANIMVGDFGEVYVMDWGLAKIVDRGSGDRGQGSGDRDQESESNTVAVERKSDPVSTTAAMSELEAAPGGWEVTLGDSGTPVVGGAVRARDGRVVTDRLLQAEMTQDGAILGTPVYMPPEQAMGRIDAIDKRSDIYALGAILYEILTLQPPVQKEGGTVAILARVVKGDIVPPRKRVRQAGIKRTVPVELEAMALKALAREPAERYQTVESFRQDIERFLDGRSVSAREDSAREMLTRLIKRNKGLSAGIALAFLLLVGSLVFISQAWLATNEAYADAQQEQDIKNKKGQKLVPAFVRAARMMVNDKQFDDALAQVEVALRYEPDDADARLLRGQLWLSEQRYEDAASDLAECLRVHPGWEPAKKLGDLCRGLTQHKVQAPALAAELTRQKAYTLATRLMELSGKAAQKPLATNRAQLLATHRTRLEERWPGSAKRLITDAGGKFTLNLAGFGDKVSDLSPLEGMPLTALNLSGCERLRYLTPLKGMPLSDLNLSGTNVADLTPLAGMPLTKLQLLDCPRIEDLTPLRGMKLTYLDMYGCPVRDLGPLKGMLLTFLSLNGCTKLEDLGPLAGMKLKSVGLRNAHQVRDLTPLQGMPLAHLDLGWSPRIQGLAILAGMKPTVLALPNSTTQEELALVKKMPLTQLDLGSCGLLHDFTPILGLKLAHLGLPATTTDKDLVALKRLPLTSLDLGVCREVHDLSPLRGLNLKFLAFWGSSVTDLSPLEGMQLEHIRIPPPRPTTKGLDVLRRMKSLRTIGIRWDGPMIWSAAEFWRKLDAGHFK